MGDPPDPAVARVWEEFATGWGAWQSGSSILVALRAAGIAGVLNGWASLRRLLLLPSTICVIIM